MKLTITQPEIEQIVRAHLTNHTFRVREDSDIEITFSATRGEDGITATIDIPYLGLAGIPEIAEAAPPAASEQAGPGTPDNAAPAPAPAPVRRKRADAVLGGGTTPATEKPVNPAKEEPLINKEAEDAAPFEEAKPKEESAPAEEKSSEKPSKDRGPSLFS